MMKAKCGGLLLDGSTLKMVNGIITVADGNPTSGVVANCGGVLFDAEYFKKINKVITDKDAVEVESVVVTQQGCGGLLVDGNCFAFDDGVLSFSNMSGEANITSFKIGDIDGTISGTDITVNMPYGTDVTSLSPTIVVSDGAKVSPKSGTSKDFTNSVEYTVTAESGTKKKYVASVVVAQPSTDCDITSFTIGGAVGVISGTDIAVEVPSGTDVTALEPTIAISANATINPASGASQDFTNAVTYTVTAQDGETVKAYTVTVTVAV